jgi:putative transposase
MPGRERQGGGLVTKVPSMPRLPRLDLPGIAQHVVQRGVDRQPCFFTDVDRIRYLDELREICLKSECRVHAYVLMTNHVHVLLTPAATGQVSRTLQALGRRYVRYVNDRYGRTGTLWEGRFKSCLVDSESYLLRCYRYIELNPVRAGMVAAPDDYRWSSFAHNAHGAVDRLIHPHATWLALGGCPSERQERYRALFEDGVDSEEIATIRASLQRQHALGSSRFQQQIEAMLGRRASPGRIGRPRKLQSTRHAESAH